MPYTKEIIAFIAPYAIQFLVWKVRPRPSLYIGIRNEFTYLIHEPQKAADGSIISPTQTVAVRSIVVNNEGTDTAKNVEVVFNWKCTFNIWPRRTDVTELQLHDGRYAIRVDSLAKGESIHIELLAINSGLPSVVTRRYEHGEIKEGSLIFYRDKGSLFTKTVVFLLALGASVIAYLLILAGTFIYNSY